MFTPDGSFNRLLVLPGVLLTAFLLFSCNDTPTAGGVLAPDDPAIKTDTIYIDSISMVSSPAFSGNLTYVTTGKLQDPLFGKTEATALLRPSIRITPEDTLAQNAKATLLLPASSLYGEQTDASYKIVEIGRRWRSSSWRFDSIPDLSEKVVKEFTYTGEDTLRLALEKDWIENYRKILLESSEDGRISLQNDLGFYGIAIVSADDPIAGGGQLLSIGASGVKIIFEDNGNENGDESKVLERTMSGWAVSANTEQDKDSVFNGSIPLLNTFGSMMKIDYLSIAEELKNQADSLKLRYSKIELALFEDSNQMQAGNGGFERIIPEALRSYRLTDDQPNYAITMEPIITNRRDEDRSYRINLTGMIRDYIYNGNDRRQLYLVPGVNDGRILPLLLYGPGDPDKQPALYITGVEHKQ